MHVRTRPGAHALAEPDRGRHLRRSTAGDHQLPLTEPEARNAIHGLVRWDAWTVRERTAERVVLAHVLHPQPGYPFTLDLEVDYALSADGLAVRTRATNLGPDAVSLREPVTTRTCTQADGLVDGLVLRAAGVDRARRRRARDPHRLGAGRRARARLPRAAADRRDACSTTPSPGSSATATGSPASNSTPRTARERVALGRRGVRLPPGLHRRPAPGRRAAAASPSSR